MNATRLVIIVAALTAALPHSAAADPATEAEAIMNLEREWSRRFQQKDVDWIVDLHLPDARQHPPNAPAVVGRAAIRAAWQSMVETEGLGLSWEPTHARVSGEMAYDVGRGTLTSPDGTSSPVKYVVVWERRDGTWKVAVDMFSPDE